MSETTHNLDLPYIMPAQAQKHVTHNEALRALDYLVQMRVLAFGTETPPNDPALSDSYGIGPAPTDAWVGQEGKIAVFDGGAWAFVTPLEGWRIWSVADQELRVYSGGSWLSVLPDLQNLEGLGVGTTSDATNRLAVASDASLLTHAGAGHQVKVNKAGVSDTASLLFQSNWSGRAEMGLTGDDDFRIKVSADGSTFTEALHVRGADGVVTAPCFMSTQVVVAHDSVEQVATPGVGGIVVISFVDDAYPQTSHSGIFAYDTGPTLSLRTLVAASGIENMGSAALTGTSGPDGLTSVSVQSGVLQLGSRRVDSTARFALTFLNTF